MLEPVDNDEINSMYGDLTIRDTIKNIKLDVEFGGVLLSEDVRIHVELQLVEAQ